MARSNAAQIELWDGRVGAKWAEMHARLDAMLAGATAALAERVGPVSGLRLLDIGCGTGATCALWLQAGAEVTGVDVSGPMLAVAAERVGGRARLLQADASDWRADTPFDLAVSQFGVMFFDEPVAAFANIAANLRPGGRLVFCCWQQVRDNGWVSVPMGAIRDLLPETPPPPPHAPGPFALADPDRLRAILGSAGFTDVRLTHCAFPVVMAESGGVEDALVLALKIGPAASALAEAGEGEAGKQLRQRAVGQLRTAFAAHEQDGRMELSGAIWLVEAARP
jgi:SAM-dependent methyltransferase